MITVTVEVGTYAGGWEYRDSAECDESGLAITARTLWDEAYTGVQGCRRRLTFEQPGADTKQIEYRP